MGPAIRIMLRYGIGGLVGYEIGSRLAEDPDIVALLSAAAAFVAPGLAALATEGFYALAKKLGWRT